MPTTLDAIRLRKGWQKMPDRRTVSYQTRTGVNPSTYGSAFSVTNAFHRNYVVSPAAESNGVYVVSRADFYFPKSANATLSPKVGDLFTDASAATVPYTGKAWSVDTVAEAGALGAWMVGCVAPEIQAAVDVVVTIYRPNASYTNSGLRKTTPQSSVFSGNGWIQQTNATAGDHIGKREMANVFSVYLPANFSVAVQAQDIASVAGVTYTILEYVPARELSELPYLRVEALP